MLFFNYNSKTNRQTNNRVALKIVKSAKNYLEAAEDEIKLLRKLSQNDPTNSKCVVHLVDDFDHLGPFGRRKQTIFVFFFFFCENDSKF